MAPSVAGHPGTVGRARKIGLGGGVSGRDLRPGEKGGEAVGKTKRGKGTKLMVAADGNGFPIGLLIASASPAEVRLAEGTLNTIRVPRRRGRPRTRPVKLIADRGYDSDPLRWVLRGRGIELVCPHRKNRKRRATQRVSRLGPYKRHWKIERLNAWLGAFRRLVVRYEVQPAVYHAFVNLACILILLRWL